MRLKCVSAICHVCSFSYMSYISAISNDVFPPRSVSATVPKGEEVAKEAAGAVGGGDKENPGS